MPDLLASLAAVLTEAPNRNQGNTTAALSIESIFTASSASFTWSRRKAVTFGLRPIELATSRKS